MKAASAGSPSNHLPIRHSLTIMYVSSLVIAIIMAVASIAGLLYPAGIYPADELLQSLVPNDVVNLVIGLPILLGSMWLAWRGKLIGLLFWPGALFYVFYTYIVYLFGMPLNEMFLLYLVLVTSSVYTMVGLVANIDGEAIRQRLDSYVRERTAGGVLAGLGILMLLRAFGVVISALVNQTAVPTVELSTLVADFVASPTWIIGGVLLWRHQAPGYVAGMGLLFQTSMLFIGLIILLLLQPLLTAAPFAPVDIVVVFMMGMVCFVPCVLFMRGVVRQ